MTHTILIGKNRRITLDELSSLSRGEAKLEMQLPATGDDTTNEEAVNENGADDDAATITAALEKLSLNSNPGSGSNKLLSAEATIASLALLSLTLAQGRVVRGECAIELSSKLVNVVNAILEKESKSNLPANTADFVTFIGSLAPMVVEDKPYLGRVISVARVSLMLAQGKLFVSRVIHFLCSA